jgi:hypothetical protein
MAEMVAWLLIVVGSCIIGDIIAGIVPIRNKSRSATLFVVAWLGSSVLACLIGLVVAVVLELPSVNIGYYYAYALGVATLALPCAFVPALAITTLVCTSSHPQTKRVSYRDTLLICGIFTAVLYFYPLVTLKLARYMLRPFEAARTQAPFLLQLTLAMMDWLWTYWYLLIPSIFLPCFFVARYRNAQTKRARASQAVQESDQE